MTVKEVIELDDFSYHKENIIELSNTTMINYQSVYQILSDEMDSDEPTNEHALYGFHSMAYSSLMTMRAYYLQNEEIAHQEFDDFFKNANQFSREFTSSREINHSMQWTFGYYNELVESFNLLADLLNVNHFNVPE